MAFIDTLHYRQSLEEELQFHREAGNDGIVMGLEVAVAALADEPAADNVIVLPCAPGNTIYEIRWNTVACNKCDHYSCWYGGTDEYCDADYCLYPWSREEDDNPTCPRHFREIIELENATATVIVNRLNVFGKTVFLTKEEAEAALNELNVLNDRIYKL